MLIFFFSQQQQHAALIHPMGSLATCCRAIDWLTDGRQPQKLRDRASKCNVNKQRVCSATGARAPVRTGRRRRGETRMWTRVSLHQLSLVDVRDPPLQLLRVLGKELELGAVALRVFPRVVVPDFGWATGDTTQESRSYTASFLFTHLMLTSGATQFTEHTDRQTNWTRETTGFSLSV